jgi:site-specific DNA recombinase
MSKRVWTLYRVSTKSQVDKDEDIPMQKNACRKFIKEKEDWELTNELHERGVSGWKSKTDERDALTSIKNGAKNKEFDILLVFMYDRLGRREDETPLVVQFLVEQGVEVWSVKEGQSRIEEHSDILMNYIRFWQSSGESKKTSIRVKEVMEQMNEHGDFTGGTPAFGYDVIETDIPHPKKDKFIRILAVNKEEAELVRLIFDLTLSKGYGAGRIARELNRKGYKNRGNIWRDNTVGRMLRNPIYMGRRRYNFTNDERRLNSIDEWKLQPLKKELAIISEETFLKTQEAIESRKAKKGQSIDAPTSSKLLLAGIATCGYCGKKLKADYSIKKYTRKTDGVTTKTIQNRYRCFHSRSTGDHPKSNYGAKMYEEQVENVVVDVLSKLNLDSFAEEANKYKTENISQKIIQLNKLKEHIQTKYRQLDKLNDEVANSLLGESKFTPEQLSKAIEKTENDIIETRNQIEVVESEVNESKIEMSDIEHLKTEFKDWEDKYRKADIASKKIMLSRILKEVQFKEKEINISFKLTIENTMKNTDENGVYNHTNSDTNRVGNTLQELLRKHLDRQGLNNIEFIIEKKVA